jgi:hypothetical protein
VVAAKTERVEPATTMKAQAASPSAPSGPPEADHPAEPPRETRTRASSPLIVELSVLAASRRFSYTDRLTPALRPYDVKAPMGAVHAELYPFAGTRVPVLRGLGVVGGYARAFGVSSADSSGTRVGTSWQEYDVGGRERLPLGANVVLGLSVGYGATDFLFDTPSFTATLPSVAYRVLRTGMDLRVATGAFSVVGEAGYLPVLSAGRIGDVFPRETVGAIEARLGAAYQVARGLELRADARYTRFFFSMNPVPGDANVAGGALDELASLSFGVAYLQ